MGKGIEFKCYQDLLLLVKVLDAFEFQNTHGNRQAQARHTDSPLM